MGIGDNKQTLVVMTNGDVYYVTTEQGKKLVHFVNSSEPGFYAVQDIKSGAVVAIATSQISSIVTKGGDRG